jgi:hypothetical protein
MWHPARPVTDAGEQRCASARCAGHGTAAHWNSRIEFHQDRLAECSGNLAVDFDEIAVKFSMRWQMTRVGGEGRQIRCPDERG